MSFSNSLANRLIWFWEPWPPDLDLAGLMGWPLAARQLAGNPDSGLPTAAEELRVLCRPGSGVGRAAQGKYGALGLMLSSRGNKAGGVVAFKGE